MSDFEAAEIYREAIDELSAERDRLRAIFEADPNRLRAMVDELETERDDLLVVQAERDRLRAVVEAAKGTITTIRADIGKWAVTGTRRLAPVAAYDQLAAVGRALNAVEAQLDASGDMGGEEEGSVTPEEMGNPDWYSDPQGYAELEAERDRLRAVVWGETKMRARIAGSRSARDEAVAERDRLRVLVEAAQRWYRASDLEELQHAVDGLKAAVRQLDGDDHGTGPTGGVADNVRGVDGGADVAPASPVAGDEDGHTNQGVGKQYMSNACIHDKHDVCDEECPYCHDGCACSCHPWNETTLGGADDE